MRIVFVSYEYPPEFVGGIGTYVAAMSRILAGRGHDVTVLTVTEKRCPWREVVDGVMIVRTPLARVSGPEPTGTLRCWQSRSDAVADLLTRMSRAGLVDVIEFADYRGEGVTYLSATEPGRRPLCVMRLHTSLHVLNRYNSRNVRYPVLESFEEQAILLADRVVSPSEALARELRGFLPDLGDVDLSPYPFDLPFVEQVADAAHSPGAPGRDVVYAGRLEQRKGVETLIEAAPAFLDACPDARLHLIGGDVPSGPDIRSMRAHLERMVPGRLRDRVLFHGVMTRDKLAEHYLAARVCVFPSLFENFPNTCLEAMSLGRPVIGTDNSGMAEMMEDGVSGVIVPAGNPEALAGALVDLNQRDDEALRTMGRAARERILTRYNPSKIAEQVEDLFESYLGEHPWPVSALPGDTASSRAADAVAGDAPVRVAVVIPCYNHGAFIEDALASVKAQDYPHVECVVVDDGSTDPETIQELDRLQADGVRVIRQENQGLAAARNTGVRAIDAPFFVPLDADDRIAPNFISALMEPMSADPALGYCYGQVEYFGAADGVWECPAYDPRRLLVENLSVATALVRRSAFDLVGGYSRDMVYGFEDWDFWLALLAAGYHGHRVASPLFFYRKHPAGRSMLAETQRHRAAMVHQMIEHHRELFASMLEASMADKDSMFFKAHMDAWRLREHLVRQGVPDRPPVEQDPLYQQLMTQAELDYIVNSRSWQTVQRIRRSRWYGMLARLRFGRDWRPDEVKGDPQTRLDQIKASRFYRLIQAIKRTAVYRWYARRKHGPDFDQAPLHTSRQGDPVP